MALAAACTSHVGSYTEPDAGDTEQPPGQPDAAEPVCEAELTNVTLEPMPPRVQVVVDQSGSMNRDFGGLSRWDAVERALVDPAVGVVARLSGDVVFGASLYHSHNGHAGGTCPVMRGVGPSPDTLGDVRDLLAANEPGGDTPTAETVEQLVADFAPLDASRRTVILLATDSDPDNCNGPDSHNLFSQVLTENAVDTAYAAGIETVVLSVGTDATETHLQRVANLGAGQPVHTGSAPYYVATDPDELVTAFEAMVDGTIPTCVFRHGLSVAEADAQDARIWLDGTELERGVGWVWLDETSIELIGDACDTALDDRDVLVTGQLPC